MKIIILIRNVGLILVCFLCHSTAGQITSNSESERNSKAASIIEKAKVLIYKETDEESVKSIFLEYDSINTRKLKNGDVTKSTRESKLFIASLDQIKIEEYSDFTTNQHLSVEILNLPKVSITSDVLVNGKPFSFGSNLSNIVSKLTKEQRIRSIRLKVSDNLTPLLINTYWAEDLKFSYSGEAESKDFKADIVEIIDKTGSKRQLLFDKTSGLPIMMIEKFTSPITEKEIERKTYYSDYKTLSGLLVPHKTIVQTGDTFTEDCQLKKIEINPTFKANLFEVKEDRINPY